VSQPTTPPTGPAAVPTPADRKPAAKALTKSKTGRAGRGIVGLVSARTAALAPPNTAPASIPPAKPTVIPTPADAITMSSRLNGRLLMGGTPDSCDGLFGEQVAPHVCSYTRQQETPRGPMRHRSARGDPDRLAASPSVSRWPQGSDSEGLASKKSLDSC